MTDETEFRRWRREVRLTQAQAALRLGLSKSQVENLDAGQDRTRGRPSVPSLAVRHLMRAIAEGKQLEPWPAGSLSFTDKLKQQIAENERLLEKARRETPHLADIYQAEIERLTFLLERDADWA